MLKKSLSLAVLLTLSALNVNATTKQVLPDREPEATTEVTQKKQVFGEKFMVAAANPYAVQAGQEILAAGGSAIDAAIAVQLVLTLVEPQSSGIGGGGFILHYDKKQQVLTSYDGRETAPKNADETLFFDNSGKPVRWIDAVVGGRSVGVPGVLAALAKAHETQGKLPWKTLFASAIKLSKQGFVVSPRLHGLLKMQLNPGLTQLPVAKAYFYPNGEPLAIGTVKKNPKLAALYEKIAEQGVSAFYQGKNAQQIAAAVQNAAIAPGLLSAADINHYHAKERAPICVPYHQYRVCSMAPPSSGGMAVLQILALLEGKNLAQYSPNSPQALHYFTQASKLAFADRALYMADPDFQPVPTQSLLAPDYLKKRALLITEKDLGKAEAGNPVLGLAVAKDDAFELPSTTHISIVDSSGNAVSMTSSIEMAFGSAVMVNGYLLNNQLTDFALSPSKNGKPMLNRVEGGKRPRSSMSPIMVFNADGSLRLVLGSPGGSRIINYVAQTLIGVLDWQLTAQQAMNLPHITNRNGVTVLEKNTPLAKQQAVFEKRGHKVKVSDLNSGLHAVEITPKGLYGSADPRREGIALSEKSH